jgi:hypothetical protein
MIFDGVADNPSRTDAKARYHPAPYLHGHAYVLSLIRKAERTTQPCKEVQGETKLTSFIGGVAYLEGQPRRRRLDSS